jgi:hypothetical protein
MMGYTLSIGDLLSVFFFSISGFSSQGKGDKKPGSMFRSIRAFGCLFGFYVGVVGKFFSGSFLLSGFQFHVALAAGELGQDLIPEDDDDNHSADNGSNGTNEQSQLGFLVHTIHLRYYDTIIIFYFL